MDQHEQSVHNPSIIPCPAVGCSFKCLAPDVFALHYKTHHPTPAQPPQVEHPEIKTLPETRPQSLQPSSQSARTVSKSKSVRSKPYQENLPTAPLYSTPSPSTSTWSHSWGPIKTNLKKGQQISHSSSSSSLLKVPYPLPIFAGIRDWDCMTIYKA